MTTTRIESKGGVLEPNAGIRTEYATAIIKLISMMAKDTKREMRKVFKGVSLDSAMDDISDFVNPSIRARVAINKLLPKWKKKFNKWSKKLTDRMIDKTVKNSAVSLGLSLKQISESLTIGAENIDERLEAIISASALEAANLIKLIPEEYLNDVQGAVMRSITTGNGLQDLIPYMNEKYQQNVRHARNVAMDQTRKAYSNITAARMQSIGVDKYEWLHSGGSQHPRELHKQMNGKTFSLSDPPVIGTMYGKEVRGKPGDLPYCRCKMRPLVTFE